MQVNQRLAFHQAIEDQEPRRFIKMLLSKNLNVASQTDEKTRLNSLQLLAHEQRVDMMLDLFEADTTLNVNETKLTLGRDEKTLSIPLSYEKPALRLSQDTRKQFDMTSEVLLAFGADAKQQIDPDIFCGILYWIVTHSEQNDLLDKLAFKEIPQVTLEHHLFGLIELAAKLKKPSLAIKLLENNHKRFRVSNQMRHALAWGIQHELKEVREAFQNKSVKTIHTKTDTKKLSPHQLALYDLAKNDGSDYFDEKDQEDLLTILSFAHQERDYVAMHTLLQYFITQEYTDDLLQYALNSKNRSLFFTIVFATEEYPRDLIFQFPNQKEKLIQLMGEEHRSLTPQPAPSTDSLSQKMILIDTFLTHLESFVRNYGFLKRFWDLSWGGKFYVSFNLGLVGFMAYSFYTLGQEISIANTLLNELNHSNYTNGNNTYPCSDYWNGQSNLFADCLANSTSIGSSQSGCQPCDGLNTNSNNSIITLISLPSDALGISTLLFCTELGGRVYSQLFSDLHTKIITDIPNHDAVEEEAETLLENLRAVPDLKLTMASTIGEFHTQLTDVKNNLSGLIKRYSVFADVPANVDHKTEKDTSKQYHKLNG